MYSEDKHNLILCLVTGSANGTLLWKIFQLYCRMRQVSNYHNVTGNPDDGSRGWQESLQTRRQAWLTRKERRRRKRSDGKSLELLHGRWHISKKSSSRPVQSPRARVSCWRRSASIQIELVFIALPCSVLWGKQRWEAWPLHTFSDGSRWGATDTVSQLHFPQREIRAVRGHGHYTILCTAPRHHHQQRKVWVLWTRDQFHRKGRE